MIATVLAVAEETGFWQTEAGGLVEDVLRGLVAIGVIAAAWKGVRYLLTEVLGLKVWVSAKRKEAHRRDELLDEMLSPTGWPHLVQEVHQIKTLLADSKNMLALQNIQMTEVQTAVEQVITTQEQE